MMKSSRTSSRWCCCASRSGAREDTEAAAAFPGAGAHSPAVEEAAVVGVVTLFGLRLLRPLGDDDRRLLVKLSPRLEWLVARL